MGEHQLPPDSLLVGLLADQRLELGHDQRVPPGGQIGVDALGDRVKTRRSQPHRLAGTKGMTSRSAREAPATGRAPR